jgi:hypothetical protein
VDQKEIYAYLKKRLSPEESRNALYKAASMAKEAGWTFMEASFQLGDKALEDGLGKELVEATIRKAFTKERRKIERADGSSESSSSSSSPASHAPAHLEFDQESLDLLHSQRINPDALSIPWPSDDWRKDLIKLLETAFDEKDQIQYKLAGTPEMKTENVETILANRKGINKVMRSLDGEEGALICINAAGSSNGDLGESYLYRYALVDSPHMTLAKQLAFYKALNLPCAALVNSGANTVQAWVKIDADDSNEYADRVDFLYSILEDQGFKVDHTNKSPTQLVRMPGVLRQGRQQYLIGLNEGAKNWKEWDEWVDYNLDGNPLAELASYHPSPPTHEAAIVDGILAENQSLILQGTPKSGKSHLLLDMALSSCHGKPWMDIHTNETDVLYVCMEQDKSTFLNRLHKLAESLDVAPDSDRFGFFCLRGFPKYGLELAQFISKRIRGARKYENRNYKLVIIDPISKMLPPDSSDELSLQLSRITDHIIATTGAAVVGTLDTGQLRDTSWVDNLLHLQGQSQLNHFQLSGTFKQFPSMPAKPCVWDYPRFRPE